MSEEAARRSRRRRDGLVTPLAALAAAVGVIVNVFHQSELVEALALDVVVLGMAVVALAPIMRLRKLRKAFQPLYERYERTAQGALATERSQATTAPPLAARLNRFAAENEELVEAVAKVVVPVVVPVVVALVAFAGVMLTVVAGD